MEDGNVAGIIAGPDGQELRLAVRHSITQRSIHFAPVWHTGPKKDSPVAARPTLLQIIPELETGGAEQTAVDVAAAAAESGWHALIASQGGRMVKQVERAGGHHITLPLKSKNPLTIVSNARRIANLVGEYGVDILHARSRAPAWSALMAARRTGRPLVTTYHGAYKQAGALKGCL